MKLGERLNLAAAFVTSGTVIDIGSDHAYLPVYLIKTGVCQHAAATDINPAPLERAKETAKRYNVCDQMEFFLSDGFNSVDKTFDTACICGMGGNNIADIIENGRGKFTRLVLQPMTKAELLRKYLWDNGFVIERESYAIEGGKPYVVMLACPKEGVTEYTYNDLFLGKIRPDTLEYKQYVKKIKSYAEKRFSGTKHISDEGLINECINIIKN